MPDCGAWEARTAETSSSFWNESMGFSCQPRTSQEMLLHTNATRPPRMVPSKSDFVTESSQNQRGRCQKICRIVLRNGRFSKSPLRRLGVLRDAQYVAVWILEPGDLITAWGGPNAEFAILDERVLFDFHAPLRKPACDGFDVFDFPSEDGGLQGSEIRDFCDPNFVPSDAHDERIRIETHEFATELALIECPRPFVVAGWNEPDHLS